VSTLLIELAGPQQAWGSRSRFVTRGTELAPTKSGVVGMLAAALGMDRTAPLDRFAGLRFGVRIDQPGQVERDFQTVRSLDGSASFPLSERYYLADAVFLAGIEHRDAELAAYRDALARPYFPLFLGRRAFPPAGPVRAWLVHEPLDAALRHQPWLAREHHRRETPGETVDVEIVRDAEPGERGGQGRQDVPESFDPRRRRYGTRAVITEVVELDHPEPTTDDGRATRPRRIRGADTLLGTATDHDAETLLADEEV